MKLHFERDGTVFEYELKPMKEGRFRALCSIAGGCLYVWLTWVITSRCGLWGLIPLAFVTVVFIGLDKME